MTLARSIFMYSMCVYLVYVQNNAHSRVSCSSFLWQACVCLGHLALHIIRFTTSNAALADLTQILFLAVSLHAVEHIVDALPR